MKNFVSDDRAKSRQRMVETQLIKRGIIDKRVLEAFTRVPRHRFVADAFIGQAYEDYPLPIGSGQTISQPYMVAAMTECLELKGRETILEIGTGSGYQTAILADLAERVYTVERIEELAHEARRKVEALGYHNVAFRVGDGTIGWQEFAPYDRIIVTAGSPSIPTSLLDQLGDEGVMVIPIGGESIQQLNQIRKHKGHAVRKELFNCVFVPLLGKEGWKNSGE